MGEEAAPELSISWTPGFVTLRWPDGGSYQLYTARDLAAPVDWVLVGEPPAMVQGVATVTLPVGDYLAFFRLSK